MWGWIQEKRETTELPSWTPGLLSQPSFSPITLTPHSPSLLCSTHLVSVLVPLLWLKLCFSDSRQQTLIGPLLPPRASPSKSFFSRPSWAFSRISSSPWGFFPQKEPSKQGAILLPGVWYFLIRLQAGSLQTPAVKRPCNQILVSIKALTLTGSVSYGKPLNLSMPQSASSEKWE